MYKFILILICLFSPSFSQVLAPMSLRNFEFPVDDICYYQKTSDDFIYVEPCEKDYKCQTVTNSASPITYPQIGICSKTSQEQPTFFGKSCSTADDCYDGINCVSNKCNLVENDNALEIDSSHYYCPDGLIPVLDSTNLADGVVCKATASNDMNGLCYKQSSETSSTPNKLSSPGYMKVCGEIKFGSSGNNYPMMEVSKNSLGSVDNGKFVQDEMACKSGFALNFYPDGKISSTTTMQPYKKCVQFNGVEYKRSGSCKVKYIVGNNNYVYDVDKADASLIGGNKVQFCSDLKFKETYLDLFKQYINKINQLGEGCTKSNYYDEPYTCRNDELRKLYYSMQNVEEYLLYKNEDEITEYLLQNEYPSYAVKFSKTDGSDFISNKFIYLLFLLLL